MSLLPKILIYSPPGHGKTFFLGTAVGDKRCTPLLILDFEGGLMSIESKVRHITAEDLSKKDFKPSEIDAVRITEWDDFTIVYNLLTDNMGLYRTVAVDSLSEVNYMNLATVVKRATKESLKHDPDIPEQRDYLRSSTQMRRLIRAFRDLPMTIIFTAHTKEERDPRTSVMQLRPNLVGKLPNELPGMLDIMGYLAIDTSEDDLGNPVFKRVLVVQPSSTIMAKDRSEGGKLGSELLDPTLTKLFDLLEN